MLWGYRLSLATTWGIAKDSVTGSAASQHEKLRIQAEGHASLPSNAVFVSLRPFSAIILQEPL
jgi:hypothetical protein